MLTFSSQNLCEDYGCRREISYTTEHKILAFKIQGKLNIWSIFQRMSTKAFTHFLSLASVFLLIPSIPICQVT